MIDINNYNIYINIKYFNTESFIKSLSDTVITKQSYCLFESLLNTTYPTQQPTKLRVLLRS